MATSQEAPTDLESQIPELETGRLWLVEQYDTLDTHLDDLEMTLGETVKAAVQDNLINPLREDLIGPTSHAIARSTSSMLLCPHLWPPG